MFNLVTVKGNRVVMSNLFDIQTAREALAIYNAKREAIKRTNTAAQVRWSRGYNAARDAMERAYWLKNTPRKSRVPAEVYIVGEVLA